MMNSLLSDPILMEFLQIGLKTMVVSCIAFSSLALLTSLILLMNPTAYTAIEKTLTKKKYGTGKLSFPWAQKEVYTIHDWLFSHRKLFAPLAIIASLGIIITALKYL